VDANVMMLGAVMPALVAAEVNPDSKRHNTTFHEFSAPTPANLHAYFL
jgi:hypothetical protein